MLTDELLRLDEIGDTRAWNYEKPTLVREGRYSSRLPTKAASFRDKFYEKFPALKSIKMDNIVFKGGCILDILLDNDPKDLDLFLVGLNSQEAALERVKELLNNFLAIEKDHVDQLRRNELERYEKTERRYRQKENFDMDIKAIRTGVVITMRLSALSIPVQIVLLRYDNVAHCLRDDDIGATAIAFDGEEIWLNAESKFAIENLTILVKPQNLTGFAAKRLAKYFDKGFDLALPELDMAKLPRHYQKLGLADAAALPGLVFAYDKIKDNKIFVREFIDKKSEEEEEELMDKEGGGGDYAKSGQLDGKSQLAIRAENIQKLCNDTADFVHFAEGDFLLSVLQMWPGITSRQIANFYNSFKRQLVHGHNFNFGIAKKYFVMHSVAQIANKLFTAENMDEALDALTGEHIKRAEEKLQNALAGSPEKEMVAIRRKEWDDCKAFPRIYKQSAEFYGEFHNKATN